MVRKRRHTTPLSDRRSGDSDAVADGVTRGANPQGALHRRRSGIGSAGACIDDERDHIFTRDSLCPLRFTGVTLAPDDPQPALFAKDLQPRAA